MDDTDSLDPEIVEENPQTVFRLTELAARITGQHYSCESIETHDPPLDEALLKKVSFWAFPQDAKKLKIFAGICHAWKSWRKGEILCGENKIQDIRQVGFMVTAIINEQISKVSVTFEKQQITSSTCDKCPTEIWCSHIVAVILYRIRHADTVSIHAPVTETLSTLTRDQLQKLLQYAINEDPAGILGRVFQHIDALRDAASDMNNLQGAPDPTFGVSMDDKFTWSHFLDVQKKYLMNVLQEGYTMYPDSCNIVEKKKSDFYDRYFQRVIDLLENEEPASASDVLITIAESALDVINQEMSPSNIEKRVLCDCERLFSCFIVSCPKNVKHQIVAKARLLNARARQLTPQVEFTKPSLWADMSSIKLPSKKQEGEMGLAVEGYPFYQAVCASLIPSPPQSLQDLFCCRYSTTTSSYEEPLPVMLIRLDCLTSLEPTVSGDKVQKLGIMILKKLLVLSLKLSILGAKESTVHLEAVAKDDGPSEDGPTKAKRRKPSTSKGKAKKKTSVPGTAAGTSDTTSEDCEQIEGLTKGQISYCLLYVSYTVSQPLDKHPLDSDEVFTLLDSILRAVELGRFRSVAPKSEITSKDYSWLVFLEDKIKETYTKVAPKWLESEGNVTDMYKLALFEKGLQFYGDNVPVSLISLLLAVGKKTKQMIKLCTDTICHSLHPLKGLTIPTEEHAYRTDYNKDSVVNKWKNLITCVLDFCTTKASVEHTLILTRILKHLLHIDDCDYMMAAYSVLQGFESSLVKKEHKVLMVKVVLHGVENSIRGTWTDFSKTSPRTWDTLTKLGKQLDLEFPKLILPVWGEVRKFHSPSQLKDIREVMKDSIKKETELPAETISVLLQYFESNFEHDEECCELLHLFKITDKGYQQALKMIATNFENYTVHALLLIAKRHHEETPTSKLTADNALQKDVFNLIRLALSHLQMMNRPNLTENEYFFIDSETLNYLKYFFEKFSEKDRKEVASGKQFQNFLTHLSDGLEGSADTLVIFLKYLENTKHMLPKAKEKLGPKIIESFQKQIDFELGHCNHTSYGYVLKGMKKARQSCIQFVNKGDMLFRTAVTNYVSHKHKGKKKFIKLMNENLEWLDVG